MFEGLSEKLERSFKILKGQGYITEDPHNTPSVGGTVQRSFPTEGIRRVVFRRDWIDLRKDRNLGPGYVSQSQIKDQGKDG